MKTTITRIEKRNGLVEIVDVTVTANGKEFQAVLTRDDSKVMGYSSETAPEAAFNALPMGEMQAIWIEYMSVWAEAQKTGLSQDLLIFTKTA